MNTKGIKNRPYPEKVFLTQREMRRLRLENQLWPRGNNNVLFVMEAQHGPSGTGVPSFRRCHKKANTHNADKAGISGYTLRIDTKRKVKKFWKAR